MKPSKQTHFTLETSLLCPQRWCLSYRNFKKGFIIFLAVTIIFMSYSLSVVSGNSPTTYETPMDQFIESKQQIIEDHEVTSNDTDFIVLIHYIVLTPSDKSLKIAETLIYQNTGEKTFVNSTLRFNLPHDHYNSVFSVMDCCLIQTEDLIYFDPMDPLPPESLYELGVEYEIPLEGFEHIFSKKLVYYTESIHFFIDKERDINVTSEELEDAGDTLLENRVYQVLTGSYLNANSQINVKLSGFSSLQTLANYLLIVALLSTIAVVTTIYLKSRKSKTPSRFVSLLQREILASEVTINKLENDFKSGSISQKIFEHLKNNYETRKTEALNKLKGLKEKR